MSAAGSATPQRSVMDVFAWIASLFTLNRSKFHPVVGVIVTVILVMSLLVLRALGHEELGLSFSFGLLFTAITGVAGGGTQATRVRWSGTVALVGTLLTALGFILGGASWTLVTLAVFVSTLLSYFAVVYGRRGALSGTLLNAWFVIALSIPFGLHKSPREAWALAGPQALAWLAGGALWLVLAWVIWLVQRARQQQSSSVTPSQTPQVTAPPRLSRPLITFSLLAAAAVGLATAVAWGFDLSNADWMPIAAIVAMKPSPAASAYASGQRVAGAILGGLLAGLLLSAVHDTTLLEVVIVLFVAVGITLHEVNYAHYYTCISVAVLTALALPHPGNLSVIWERVLWTLVGVAIALGVTFLAGLISHREQPRVAAT
jgi:hypothetical protein